MRIRRVKKKQQRSITGAEKRFLRGYKEFFKRDRFLETPFYNLWVSDEHEPITFNMNGMKYTPDFLGVTEDEEVVVIEVKATKRQRGYYYSRSRIIASHMMLPHFHYIIVEVGGSDDVGTWIWAEMSRDNR